MDKKPQTYKRCEDWLHRVNATVRWHDFRDRDVSTEVCTITVPGKPGCKLTRRTLIEAVGAAYDELHLASREVFQLELELVDDKPSKSATAKKRKKAKATTNKPSVSSSRSSPVQAPH